MDSRLNVTIVGGGLAGTIAARVLREHHNVTVLERSTRSSEIGAAINLGPTATKIVEGLGFDRKRAGSIVAVRAQTFNKEAKKIHSMDMKPFQRYSQADWLFQHRADMWEEFYRLATAPSSDLGISGQPAKWRWGVNVVNVDVESGDVTLADGSHIPSDLVIAADGIKSVIRPLVVGEEAFRTARPSGASAFRFTLPIEKIQGLLGDSTVMDASKPSGLDVHLALDQTNRSIVMYPCRDFKLLNFVCIVPDSILGMETTESWSATGTQADLLRCYEDFGPFIKNLFRQAEDIKLWQLRDQDPLPTYVKGRTVLVGDAAHAMTPHQGQGGTQAVEDAEGLILFNASNVNRESVGAILKDFDRVRRTRASKIQDNTREAHERKSPEAMFTHSMYNWTYPGIKTCLERLNAGQEMIEI